MWNLKLLLVNFSLHGSTLVWDFPSGLVVKNSPANAGDTVSIPGLGISLMLGNTKPMHHNYWSLCTLGPVFHNLRCHGNKKSMHHTQRAVAPQLTTRESPPSTKKTQHSQKILNKFENGQKNPHWSILHFEFILYLCMILYHHVSHLQSIGSLIYTDLPNVDIFCFTT